MKAELLVTMWSPVKYAINGEFIKYIINIKNIGEFDVFNVVLRDILSPDLKFIEESICIENERRKELNITSGINLGRIGTGEKIEISFDVQILSKKSMLIGNCAVVEYNYCKMNRELVLFGSNASNISEIFISIVDIKIEENKSKKFAMIDDEIIYCLNIENCGDLDITNVKLKEDLPKNIKMIEDSFMINDQMLYSVNLEKGVNIGKIKSKFSKLIRFKVKVKGNIADCIELNEKCLEFTCVLPDSTACRKRILFSENDEKLKIKPTNFSDLNLDYCLMIPKGYPELKEINNINVEIEILNKRIIKNSENVAADLIKRTGCKMILNCKAKYHIQYVGCDCEETTQSVCYEIPFSSSVALARSFESKCRLKVDINIENIYSYLINSKEFFVSTSLLIIVN